MNMSFSDKTPTAAEGGSPKKSKKKLKKEDAWRPEGPRDPFVMVCVLVRVRVHGCTFVFAALDFSDLVHTKKLIPLCAKSRWVPPPSPSVPQLDSLPEKKQQEIQRALHLFSPGPSLPRTLQQAESHAYRFWDTQPVPRLGERRFFSEYSFSSARVQQASEKNFWPENRKRPRGIKICALYDAEILKANTIFAMFRN